MTCPPIFDFHLLLPFRMQACWCRSDGGFSNPVGDVWIDLVVRTSSQVFSCLPSDSGFLSSCNHSSSSGMYVAIWIVLLCSSTSLLIFPLSRNSTNILCKIVHACTCSIIRFRYHTLFSIRSTRKCACGTLKHLSKYFLMASCLAVYSWSFGDDGLGISFAKIARRG